MGHSEHPGLEEELVGKAQAGQVLMEAPEVAATCPGEEEGYLVGQEVAGEEGAHVEEGLGADQVGDQGEGLGVARAGDPVVEVEVKAHAVLVNQEVSGKEELPVEGQEEGQWVALGASVEGLEAVLVEVAQA